MAAAGPADPALYGGSWPYLVAAGVFVPEVISIAATLLHRSRIGTPPPAELDGVYDAAEFASSNTYTRAKLDFGLVKGVFDLGVFYAFWLLGGFPWADRLCVGLGFQSEVVTGLVFVGVMSIASSLLDIPWSVYHTFVLEERFGFNKTTPLTFVKDQVKTLLLTVAIGGPILALVLWFFTSVGPNAWLYVFLTITAISLILLFLMPVLILPLFYSLVPLPEGTAIITGKTDKSVPGFLSGRLFYRRDGPVNGKTCWKTLDKRFAGATSGSVLSLYWHQPSEGSASWAIIEGTPEETGSVWATCGAESIEEAKPLAEGPKWELTTEARAAVAAEAPSQPASMHSDPLVSKDLRTTCVDVGALRSRLLALADRLGYKGANIFVIDGSTRSEHSNAFCTGFGRFRRICLFDTLLPLMDEGEIVSVLGHEIGHDRLYHVHAMLVLQTLMNFVMFFALGKFLYSQAISSAFFVPEPKVYLGVVLFSVVWSVVSFVVMMPLTMMSRANEYAADRYSVDADKAHGGLLGSALLKLSKKSKAMLTPHPFYVFLNYSHPPMDFRLRAMREYHVSRHGADN